MIKLVCEKCTHTWFTANTSINQRCCDCGEKLIEVDCIRAKEIEKSTESIKL